jgi:uncharacterized protein YuzE
MAARLTFHYDWRGDVLYIASAPPRAGQRTEELGDEVIARISPATGEVECLEILSFSRRLQDGRFELPIAAVMIRAD